MSNSHLTASRASDLDNSRDRFIYRALEILPATLSWSTLVLAVLASWLFPVAAAFFIIGFVIYWFFRVLYFAFYLRTAYKRTRENEKVDWLEKLNTLPKERYSISVSAWQEMYHLIAIPTYNESVQILREAFSALRDSDYPKDKMIVVLAMEERAGKEIHERAAILKKEFGDTFFKFLVVVHPADIPGEIAGKGSNETWAVKEVKKQIIDPLGIPYEQIIMTSLDADTVVLPKYFSCLTHHYLTSKDPTHSSYQPVPLFLNNIWQASAISRIFAYSTTFWFLMNQERAEKMSTFSSHSMSFKALVEVGYRQVNYAVDDSRIFWQCFLKYDGNYAVEALYYPISMDANVAPTFLGTVKNMYKQQQRWAYGVADIPYFVFGFLKNKKIPLSKKISFTADRIESYWSWATTSILIFLLGWLPLFLGGDAFSQTLLSYNLPRLTAWILTTMMVGLVWSVYLSIVLLPPRPLEYGRWRVFWLAAQWLLLPPIMVFFAIPALDAQTRLLLGKYMGFWVTPKFRK